ncbi:MAG: OmpA family protein [Bacteroidota bacterium]
MRAFLLGFLVFSLWSVFARYYYVCKIKNNCAPTEVVDPALADIRPKTLSLMDGDSVILKEYEQLAFDSSSTVARLNPNNLDFLDKVAEYLKQHPDKTLTLTGYYRENEEGLSSGFHENLGSARAAIIRGQLGRRGVPEQQVFSKFDVIKGNELLEPVSFIISGSGGPDAYGNNGERLVRQRFSFTNMSYSDANFEHDSAEFLPGDAFKFYADSVSTYLKLNTNKKLTIIGHTDSDGNDFYNNDLGLDRAKAARQYFYNLGVNAEINVGTKGEKEPVAPNDTPENKQKNRRVNIIIE